MKYIVKPEGNGGGYGCTTKSCNTYVILIIAPCSSYSITSPLP